jgi:hypothetical protein
MKQSLRPRNRFKLSEPISHQLDLYALASGAAGVGMLALLSQPSEAKIVYTKTHVVIESNHTYQLDLNHDGIGDFKLRNYRFFTDTYVATFSALPAQSKNRVVGKQLQIGSPYSAYALRRGTVVGPKQPFSGALMAGTDGFSGWGRWDNVSDGYLGLKLRIKGKVHYGWARMKISASQNSITGTLTGYAYETIPNKPIIAGKSKGPDVITTPADTGAGTLGRLALGRK